MSLLLLSSSLFASSLVLAAGLRQIASSKKQSIAEKAFLTDLDRSDGKEVELLPVERDTYTMIGPISTVTFYEGDVDNKIIIHRMEEIIRVNPWLAGRLIRREGQNVKLRYPLIPSTVDLKKHVQEINILNYQRSEKEKLDASSPVDQVLSELEDRFVKPGINCINKDEVLFNILVVKIFNSANQPATRTAFVMTLSHVIADGRNFYSIYSFFHPSTPIKAIDPVRDLSFPDRIKEIQGSEYAGYPSSLLLLLRCLKTLLFEYFPAVQRYKIDPHALHHRKHELLHRHQHDDDNNNSKEAPAFLSSNDFLSWWFMQSVQCSHGLMAVNCRGRLPGLTEAMAGNYTTLIIYSHQDYSTGGPAEIRRSLRSLRSSSAAIPSARETVAFRISTLTNWASFYAPVVFDERCPLLFHSPLVGNRQIVIRDHLIVFRYDDQHLGLLLFSRTKNSLADWLEQPGNEFLQAF